MVTIPVPVLLTIPTDQASTMEKEILTTAVMENLAQTALFPNQSRVTKVEDAPHRALKNDKQCYKYLSRSWPTACNGVLTNNNIYI